jgi:uncharacterized protein YggE
MVVILYCYNAHTKNKKLQMKKISLMLCFLLGTFLHAQNIVGLPRTIQVEGEKVIMVAPDEYDMEVVFSNMDSKTNAKLPIDKVVAQLKQFMTRQNIPLTKFEDKTNPTMCSPASKTCNLNKIQAKEFEVLKTYLLKNAFVSSTTILKKRIFKGNLEKVSNELVIGALDDAKERGLNISKIIKEPVSHIHSVKTSTILLSSDFDYETTSSYESLSEQIDSVKFTFAVNLEYAVETITEEKMVVFPKTIYAWGSSYNINPYKQGDFSFYYSLQDYEEGEPKEAFKKNKDKLMQFLASKGIQKSQIIEGENSNGLYEIDRVSSDEANLSTYIQIKNLTDKNKIKELYDYLSIDKNITSLSFAGKAFDASEIKAINNTLTEKAISASRGIAEKIAKHLGVEIKRVFDITDYALDKYYFSDLNYKMPRNEELDLVNRKDVYISFELK